MASNVNLHKLLREKPYNLEKVRQFLERDHSSINEPDEVKKKVTPLVTVLRNSHCSIEIVRLLLQFGADVNLGCDGTSPLLTALEYFKDEAIIEALLREGANIDVLAYRERTPLCYIFNDCNRNRSGNFEWKKKVLQLLLQAGLDLSRVIANGTRYDGKTHLCLVLVWGARVRDIELLLSKGGSLNACTRHATPLHCITDIHTGAPLEANVVQWLLHKQARKGEVFKMDLEPLKKAVRLTRYETSAIRLLLDHSDEKALNTWIRQMDNVLHLVVGNPNCKTTIVKLFLERGACIDKLNESGESVLHFFMRTDRRDLSVLEFLLKSGAPVNVICRSGRTPLTEAVGQGMNNYVINLLLAYGARFGILSDRNGIFLLEGAVRHFNHNQENKYVFKTLVKYYFLEFPNFSIHRLIEGRRQFQSLFAADCTDELHRMETLNVRSDCTLRRFISENHLLEVETDQERNAAIDDCDQILKILASYEFPEYFDVMASKMLASKVAEVVLERQLKKLIVFSFNAKIDKSLGNASAIRKVVLTHDVVCKKLTQFLSDKDMLQLIVAFYNADDLPYYHNA